MGLSLDNVAKSITDVTSSSRFTNKNLWLDDKSAYTYQTQVQVPEYIMNSMEQLQSVPVVKGQMRPVLSDVADITTDSLPGEYDRSGPRRFVTVSANIYHKDLGAATDGSSKSHRRNGQTARRAGSGNQRHVIPVDRNPAIRCRTVCWQLSS